MRTLIIRRAHRLRLAALLAVLIGIGSVSGFVATELQWSRGESSNTLRSPKIAPAGDAGLWLAPADLEELLSRSDVVVLGTFTRKASDSRIAIPGHAALRAEGKIPPFAETETSISFFEVAVEEYLVGEGPSSLTIGQLGDDRIRDASDDHPGPVFGQRVLLFLIADPNDPGKYASTHGPWGRLVDRPGAGIGRMGLDGGVPFASDPNIDALGARAGSLRQ